MARLIGKHSDTNGIVEQWFDNGDDTITVKRSDDAQEALDRVARANLDGRPTIDGLGKPVIEVPLVEAMAWAESAASRGKSCSTATNTTPSSSGSR
jgi:hypothetical protein